MEEAAVKEEKSDKRSATFIPKIFPKNYYYWKITLALELSFFYFDLLLGEFCTSIVCSFKGEGEEEEEEFKDVTHRPPLLGGGGWTTNIFPAAVVVSREIIEGS